MQPMSWVDVLKIMVPVAVAVVVWLLNEYSKRQWERYKRKEDRYVTLVECLKGFYVNTEETDARERKEEFLNQLALSWLYCPDAAIHKAYSFLDHVHTGAQKSDEEKEQALGAFVLELRKDLLQERLWWWKKTKLSAQDFRTLSST